MKHSNIASIRKHQLKRNTQMCAKNLKFFTKRIQAKEFLFDLSIYFRSNTENKVKIHETVK